MVATDFGESSVQAARWSTEILASDAEHLLHVIEVPERPMSEPVIAPPRSVHGQEGVVSLPRLGF